MIDRLLRRQRSFFLLLAVMLVIGFLAFEFASSAEVALAILLQRRIEALQETLQFLDGKIQGYDQWNSAVEEQIKKGWSRP